MSTAAVISTACTQKNGCGVLDHAAPAQARSSRTIASANRGHTTTLNTPAPTRNHHDLLPTPVVNTPLPTGEEPRP